MFRFFLFSCLIIWSFSCSTLLNADFENIPVQQAPPPDLPGPPEGDLLSWSEAFQSSTALQVVALEAGSQQALELNSKDAGVVVFQSLQPDQESVSYQLSFQLYTRDALEQPLLIQPAVNAKAIGTTVRMQQGIIEIMQKSNGNMAYDTLGQFEAEAWQTFIFTIDKSSSEYTLNVIRDGLPELRIENQPLFAPEAFVNPPHLQLRFVLEKTSENNVGIRWDDVLIYQTKN
jgi:hypothetical protein